MKKLIYTVASGIILTMLTAPAAQAQDRHELIGYNVTTTMYTSNIFEKADVNNDQYLDFQEYEAVSMRDNEYATFLLIDSNNNKLLSMKELETFAAGKGFTTVRESTKRNWNMNRETVLEKHFVPVAKKYYR